ncbi:MAG: L-serine ammonia-lyase, iron-sulfur-dependent, subunit alpha [Symbiobacteriaceae bacterium]|nr:L-serine ammonia-lyase, iron-sulfur-dependent, subunit alpha [Symbiobacteriaceae bacterium]
MYNTIAELLQVAADAPLWQPILQNECLLTGTSESEVFAKLDEHFEVMFQSANRALTGALQTAGGLIEGIASRQQAYMERNSTISGSLINRAMALALSCSEVNASMGRICAAPTAGACGILPAVLISVGELYNSDRRTVLEGLLTASGIGAIITRNATVAGAEGGCQAECGVAAAMAAATAVQLAGGSNEASANAVSFALINCMGLVCDPVAGLVQVPCALRNASQTINAICSADLALSGMVSIIPADEVIDAMFRVGRMLPPELRETALGGIAATPTAKRLQKEIFGEQAQG